jgi:predicted nucleic acid-binding protein
MIIDASVIVKGFFPDEEGQAQAQALIRDYTLGSVELLASTLLPYEVTNVIGQAVRRGRIEPQIAEKILNTFQDLAIPTAEPSLPLVLELASRHDRSAYDAAYLALAGERKTQLITGDRRLYNAVREPLAWVIWIEDYAP